MTEFRNQMQATETLPLAERKANAMEWFKDLSDNYKMVAERVGWLLNGSYGKGSHDSACRVLASPRMNQVAWCAITIANLEWRCPAKMAIESWKKLPVETRYQVNEAIRREIADAKAEGYCGEIKKNGGKNVAHRLPNDMYNYRGYIIKKWDNNYLNDPEIRGFQYNVYRSMSDCDKGSSLDIVDTLREAKEFIDRMVERA
jgi:hypothetical protein